MKRVLNTKNIANFNYIGVRQIRSQTFLFNLDLRKHRKLKYIFLILISNNMLDLGFAKYEKNVYLQVNVLLCLLERSYKNGIIV